MSGTGDLKNYVRPPEARKASYDFVKKQDRSKTCFNTAVKKLVLLDRKMEGEEVCGEPKKGFKG